MTLSTRGLCCDGCGRVLGHYVIVDFHSIKRPFRGRLASVGQWFEGHRACFSAWLFRYRRSIYTGRIERRYQRTACPEIMPAREYRASPIFA